MRNETAERIRELQVLLDRAQDAALDLGNRRGWRPKTSSIEHLDANDQRFRAVDVVDPVRWGFTRAAVLQVAAGGSQLQALARLIQDPPTVYAIPTVSRAGLEVSARAAWLVDPSVDRNQRAVRRALELYGEIQWLERHGYEAAGENRQSLIRWAGQAGFEIKPSRKGRSVKIAGESPPDISALVKSLGGRGDGLVRSWEEAAQTSHGRLTGLMRYATLSASEADPRVGEWQDRVDWWQVWTYVAIPVLALLTAADRMATLAGWTSANWRRRHEELSEKAAALIAQAAEQRRDQQ